ncbi:MAG: hypothetical protein IJS81_08335 [Selenomonadaceae bacterium]|nr:hypothetical protein [Selenomonadaceae bacterium]MBQ7630201.1 hypothetical protein [Selenomonadaceae bacterium]
MEVGQSEENILDKESTEMEYEPSVIESVTTTENVTIAPVSESSVSNANTLTLEQLFSMVKDLLVSDNLNKLVSESAGKDLQELEKQLNQLSRLYGDMQGYLSMWKSQNENTVVEDTGEEMERHAVISALHQIALNDDEKFTKSTEIRRKIETLGYEVVHRVPTQDLRNILKEMTASSRGTPAEGVKNFSESNL